MKDIWCLGSWNAYCEKASTTEEENKRLNECPEEFREAVKRHCDLVRKLKCKAKNTA